MRAYALFLELESDVSYTKPLRRLERVLERMISKAQGPPGLIHTELLIVDGDNLQHFATYIGSTASFRPHDEYYTCETAGRWRAVPLDVDLTNLIDMCHQSSGAKYSVLRYACAVRPFRWVGHLLPSQLKSPGHCANLTARIVHTQSALPRNTNNYAPVSLYNALIHKFVCSVHDLPGREPQDELERSLYNALVNCDLYEYDERRVRQTSHALARHVLYGSRC